MTDFLASYISGAASIALGNPLDQLKVRLQAQSGRSPNALPTHPHTSFPPLAPNSNPTPTSPQKPTLRSARPLSGLPAPLLTYGALNALLFSAYHATLDVLPRSPHANAETQTTQAHDLWRFFVAGSVAGLATFVVSTPTEVVKCRAQLGSMPAVAGAGAASSISETRPLLNGPQHSTQSSLSITRSIWRTSGPRGFYVGGGITAVRDAIGYGFYFVTYEGLRGAGLLPNWGWGEAGEVLVCGGLAGVATWVSVFPLDVVKTRVQTQMGMYTQMMETQTGMQTGQTRTHTQTQTDHTRSEVKSALQITREMYAREGLRSFFRGLTVCCVRAFIVNAAQWAVYEWVSRALQPINNNLEPT